MIAAATTVAVIDVDQIQDDPSELTCNCEDRKSGKRVFYPKNPFNDTSTTTATERRDYLKNAGRGGWR